ncbi:MAG TPA: peptide ABC transporter substrate-binding protein [Thermomicrobiales bacterium]|jgi:oligopeptide transport system substrate-binding protein
MMKEGRLPQDLVAAPVARSLSRRALLRGAALSAAGLSATALLAACGGTAATPTSAPAPTTAPASAAPSTAAGSSAAPAGSAAPSAVASAAPSTAAGPAASAAASATQPAAITGPQPSKPRPDGTPAPDNEQVLRMVTPAAFRMDPPTYGGDLWQLQMLVFQALTRIEADGKLIGGVADKWESSADAKTWTFSLNPNAKFSDGSPITASDVKWTWEWICNPKSKATTPDVAAGKIVGFDKVRKAESETLEGIVAKDPQTVVFTLTTGVPFFPFVAASYGTATLKKDNVVSGGDEWWRKPVTSGLFKVTEFTPGDQASMTLERNEFWWREPAKLTKFTMKLVADAQTQLVQYDNNEIDGMVCQPAEFAQATKPNGQRSADLYWEQAIATWYFAFFCEKEPFDDMAVRQAFASAVDLNALSVAALNGIYPPQKRMIPAFFPAGGNQQFQPTFDPAKAKQLIAQSKYGSVDKLPKITILVSEQGGATALGTWGKVATAIQQQLQQNLGAKVDILRKVYSTVAEQQEEIRKLDGGGIFRLSVGAGVEDPSYIDGPFRSTSSANAARYKNTQVDQWLDQAALETDQTKRYALYEQIDKTVMGEAYFLAPFQGTSTWFFKPKVRGMKVVQGRIWNSLHKMYIAKS